MTLIFNHDTSAIFEFFMRASVSRFSKTTNVVVRGLRLPKNIQSGSIETTPGKPELWEQPEEVEACLIRNTLRNGAPMVMRVAGEWIACGGSG